MKYSRTPFDGFTHRFIVEFTLFNESDIINYTIYSNSGSYQELDNFINEKKKDKVKSFKIVHRASKEQDELTSKFIDEMLDEY